MHRRNFFAVAAGALIGSCVPELASAAPALRCPRCFAPAHFHLLSKKHVLYPSAPGPGFDYSHEEQHWMTPKGTVIVARWPEMDDPATMAAVETAMEAVYGR